VNALGCGKPDCTGAIAIDRLSAIDFREVLTKQAGLLRGAFLQFLLSEAPIDTEEEGFGFDVR